MAKAPSVTDVTHALKGMEFPADRDALKKHAEGDKAPEEVISAIERLPEDEFGSITDVTAPTAGRTRAESWRELA